MEAPPATSHLYGQLPGRIISNVPVKACKRELTVDVTANAGVAADSLPILAPKTVSCLGIDKAIGVHDGCDVEIELVDEGLDGCV